MDIWVLDKTLEANDIVDTFNSLIWTDRYDEYGDFEIYTSVTDQALSLLQMDYYLQSRSSEHLSLIHIFLWNVTAVEVQRPRLILSVGGVYNGQQH